jgi:hypothetical protein
MVATSTPTPNPTVTSITQTTSTPTPTAIRETELGLNPLYIGVIVAIIALVPIAAYLALKFVRKRPK